MKYTRADFPTGFLFGHTGPDSESRAFDFREILIRWSDIFPEGRGKPDESALNDYDRLIDDTMKLGQRPCLLLDQSALPVSLEDLGGWRNRDVAHWFAEFTEVVVARVGDRTFSVSPGPLAYAEQIDTRSAARALHHRLLAHGWAIRVMRGFGMGNLGLSVDARLEGYRDVLCAAFTARYPEALSEVMSTSLPDGWHEDLKAIAEPVDWCGLTIDEPTSEDLAQISRRYTIDTPLWIASNPETPAELRTQLDVLRTALSESVPVQGFMVSGAAKKTLRDCLEKDGLPTPWTQPSGNIHAHWNLVADIGGTNTRFGVVTNGELIELRKHPTGTLEDLRTALHGLCDEIGTSPRAVVAAGAGPVQDGTIHLTNAHLKLSESELAQATGARHTFVINDFTAAAWSVAEITAKDVEVLQGASEPQQGTRLVVGPGTGLGVGALLHSEGHFHTASGEGGHMGLSPRHRDEVDVFDAARRIVPECFFGDTLVLEAEMFLSGTGLPVLYQAVSMAAGTEMPIVRSAKDILQDARDGTDVCAIRTARMFTEHLGAIMGDLAVALVPRGGVFLVGGVAEKNRWLFGQDFLDAFNTGGRFDDLRRSMNLYVSKQHEFGIVGANNFCKNALLH